MKRPFINAPHRRSGFTGGGGSSIADGSEAAYSLRYITSSYSGDVILARRTIDNAELGFTPDEITDGTLASWSSGGSVHVKTWYDQSTNANHATQTTANNQPRIVLNGTIETSGGNSLPAINFNTSSTNHFDLTSGISGGSGFTSFTLENAGSSGFMLAPDSTFVPYTTWYISATLYIANQQSFFGTTPSIPTPTPPGVPTTYRLTSGFCPANGITTGARMRINQLEQGAAYNNFTFSAPDMVNLGKRNSNYTNSSGVQEFIFFNGDNSANFTTIEDDMNAYYNIYV